VRQPNSTKLAARIRWLARRLPHAESAGCVELEIVAETWAWTRSPGAAEEAVAIPARISELQSCRRGVHGRTDSWLGSRLFREGIRMRAAQVEGIPISSGLLRHARRPSGGPVRTPRKSVRASRSVGEDGS
jgi:hypothetical protein